MLQNRELGKDQATEGSAGHSKECEFYSKHDGGGAAGTRHNVNASNISGIIDFFLILFWS